MLTRIETVKGLGLLHDANGRPHTLASRTLVYGGNGRGKSTLASILRSCASGEPGPLNERVTIDGTIDAEVTLQFDSGHKVRFENNAWSEVRPEILIYDGEFIERNVHSGTDVTTENRKNLLDFALGDTAVKAKADEDSATKRQQEANAKQRQLSAQIEAYAGGTSVPVFRALKQVPEAEAKRAEIAGRLAAANQANSILQLPLPDEITFPQFDAVKFFDVLGMTLNDIHADAEAAVRSHVDSIGTPVVTDWLRQGQQFDDHETCPYCGQGTRDVPLIQMYQSFFNVAYADAVGMVEGAMREADGLTQESRLEDVQRQRALINERSAQWSAHADVNALDDSRDELARASLANLRELVAGLFARKMTAITEAVGSPDDLAEAERLWSQYRQLWVDANELVTSTRSKIDVYKATLQSEDSARIRQELADLDLAIIRHSEPVVALFQSLTECEAELQAAETAKKDARAVLTTQMSSTLSQYRADINTHLGNLGALFSIDEIKSNFMGGSPRTDYGINLRGKPVKLTGGVPSFATALSEGDKRTMAFAFFVASTLGDPQIGDKIVVVDDPMSSLDRSRREHTTELLVQISKKCQQLIVLAHDAIYLRDLRRSMTKQDDQKPVSVVHITRIAKSYSDFAAVDLDRECESEYYSNYRSVDEFVQGVMTDERKAATAMRPLMEGYLHRRYPGQISADLMFGQAIIQIRDAPAGSPLELAKSKVPEMQELNNFAGQFHHDTNPDYATVRPDAAAVATYGQRVLDLIHGAP